MGGGNSALQIVHASKCLPFLHKFSLQFWQPKQQIMGNHLYSIQNLPRLKANHVVEVPYLLEVSHTADSTKLCSM